MKTLRKIYLVLAARALRCPRPALSESILYVDPAGRCCGLVATNGGTGPYSVREITGASAGHALITAHF